MKLLTILTATMTAFTTTVTANKACRENHPKAAAAIRKFCARKDLVVPSWNAFNGAHGPENAWVGISGNCSPGEWVPQKWCAIQFGEMCAQGATSRRYGNGGCQNWMIRYAPTPPQGPHTMTVHL